MEQGQDEAEPSADGSGGGEPRGNRLLLGLVSMAVVVAGLGYVLTLGGSLENGEQGDASAESLPTPRSITRGGVTYEVARTSPAGVSLDPTDRQSLILYAFNVEHEEQPECSSLDPQARVVEESSDAVRIATFNYAVDDDAEEGTMCSYATRGDESLYKALKVRLSSALGERRLIDEKTGEVIGLLDPGYAPTPAHLPAGYQQTMVAHFTPQDGFVAFRQYRDRTGRSALEVRARSATAWTQSGKVVAHEEISNADATVTDEDYQRCVSWSPRAGLVAEVCSLGTFLSPSELLRIAKSIPALP